MINEYLKSKLSLANRRLYERMYDVFSSHKSMLDCCGAKESDIVDAYMALYNDHAELFYLSNTPKWLTTISLFGKKTKIISKPIFSKYETRRLNGKINEVKNELSVYLKGASNDVVKELRIVEYIIERTTYELNNKYNQNAATVLVKHKGQCSGIAKAVKLLCDYVGIECIIVEGTASDIVSGTSEAHAWNIVKIEGKYYHLDVTYMLGLNPSKEKPFDYSYFNGTDAEFQRDHVWDRDKFPACVTKCPVTFSDMGSVKTSDISKESCEKPIPVVTSMFFFRYEIKKMIDESKKRVTFISKIKNQKLDKLPNLYMDEAVKVLEARGIAASISISCRGEEVTVVLVYE